MFLLNKWERGLDKENLSRGWDKRWWNWMCKAIEPKYQFKPTKTMQ